MDHFLGKIWGYPGTLTVPPAFCLFASHISNITSVSCHVINSRSTRQAASSLFERWDINQNGQVTNKKKNGQVTKKRMERLQKKKEWTGDKKRMER